MKQYKILVCGGRFYKDRDKVYHTLKTYIEDINAENIVIIHGDARGADRLASDFAFEHKYKYNIEEQAFPANWGEYGRSAGYYRNLQMLEEGEPDLVIAFPGGKGTEMMVALAKKVKVPTKVIE